MADFDGESRSAWVMALAYSGSEQASLEEEVNRLQECLDCILRIERAQGFKLKEKQHQEAFEKFRKALAQLAVFRTNEKQKRNKARDELVKTQNKLRMEGFQLPDKD